MRTAAALLLVLLSAGPVTVRVHFDRNVTEAAFLERVPPRNFRQKEHLPKTVKAQRKDGAFAARLSPATYDLRVRLEDGTVVEGVHLGLVKPEASTGLTGRDEEKIRDYIAHLKTFYDKITPFFIEGWRGRDETGVEGRAKVLVECLRYRDYHLTRKKGAEKAVVWRIEIWRFERLGGGWRRLKQSDVLYRLSPSVEEFRRYKWLFCRELAGIEIKPASVDLGTVEIPDPGSLPGRIGLPELDPPKTSAPPFEGTRIARREYCREAVEPCPAR